MEGPITTRSLLATAAARARESQAVIGPVSLPMGATRASPATWLDHADVSPKVASKLMGHGTPEYQPAVAANTLGRYTQTLPDELERAGDLLDAFNAQRARSELTRSFLSPCIPPTDWGRFPSGMRCTSAGLQIGRAREPRAWKVRFLRRSVRLLTTHSLRHSLQPTIQVPQPRPIHQQVDLGDLPLHDREARHGDGGPARRHHDESCGPVHERQPREPGASCEPARLRDDGLSPVYLPRGGRAHATVVDPQDDVRVEQSHQHFEVAVARGGQERGADLSLASQVGV